MFMARPDLPPAPVVPPTAWLVDSGASTDISADAQDSAQDSAPHRPPLLFRGLEMQSLSRGTGHLEFVTQEGQRVSYRRSVDYVPNLDRATGMARLFSVRQAASLGWSFSFGPSGACARPPQGGTIPLLSDGGSYYIVPAPPAPTPVPSPKAFYSYTRHTPDKNLWHLRLGHPGVHTMDKMLRASGLSGLTYRPGDVDSFCTSCAVSKSRAAPVSRVLSDRADLPLEKLTWDIWGPVATPTHAGERYVSCFTDSNSGLTIPALLRSKADAPSVSIPQLFALAHRYGHDVVRIRVDNDSILLSADTRRMLSARHVTLESTGADQHHRLGLSERQWASMYSMAQSMLTYSGLNGHFWGFAVLTAFYLLNRQHKDSTACVPVCRVTQRPVSLAHLRVFGCPVWAHVPSARRSKFQPRAVKGVFVGYGPADVYLVFNPASRRVMHSASVQFHETWRQALPERLPLPDPADDTAALSAALPGPGLQEEPRPAEPQEEPIALRLRSSAVAVPTTPAQLSPPVPAQPATQPTDMSSAANIPGHPARPVPTPFPDLSAVAGRPPSVPPPSPAPLTASSALGRPARATVRHDYSHAHARGFPAVSRVPVPVAPQGVKAAAASPEHSHWRAAYNAEVLCLHRQRVLGPLQPLPPGKTAIPSHIVFALKYNQDGSVSRYKARAVAGGDRQVAGVDFKEVFAPAVRMASVRVFASVACSLGWPTHQWDVVTAFLNADVEEEVYIRPLPIFPPPDGEPTPAPPAPNMVHRLLKALYGIRQAPRSWYFLVSKVLSELGFTQSAVDPGV